MQSEIAADSPLDFVKFHILTQDRYEACICNKANEETIGGVSLDKLLEHLPNIKSQLIQESSDNFKLELQGNLEDRSWFTKATLTRFFQLVGSSDSLKKLVAISNEMSQLEEARKFHLSLYAQAENGIKSSDNSKNELLRAMDSRLSALTEELVSTFNQAAGTTVSLQEMMNLKNFLHHFGDVDIRNMFIKLSEAKKKSAGRAPMEKKNSPVPFISKDDFVKKTGGNNIQASGPSDSNKAIKYNASPAKAAEIERQSSSETESEEDSSPSSADEEDQPSDGRSRTVIRSATPRRSASPMRRIQIGRSGSRRTPALTIKSLPHFPARERVKLEEYEEPMKKTEVNVSRMSVQDAISLFERKQNDEKKSSVDNNNNNSNNNSNNNPTNVKKTVLRRWSSGMGESRNVLDRYILENNSNVVSEDTSEGNNVEEPNRDCGSETIELERTLNNVEEPNRDCGSESIVELERTLNVDMESEANEKNVVLNRNQDDDDVEENYEKLDSAEWSRQKEVELNQMLMKFAEYNQINVKNTKPENNRRKSSSLVERKTGLIGQSKEKGDERLKGEIALKRVVKPAETKPKPKPKLKIQEKPKPEKSPIKVSDHVEKRITTSKTQNMNKSVPVVPKKTGPAKSSPLPAVRKSWPSTPSPRTTGTLPSKMPTVSRQKPQSPASLPNLQQKDMKKTPVDSRKILKKADDVKSRVVPKRDTKTAKTAAVVVEDRNVSPKKPVLRKKTTKRSSVVPVEAKPEERKVSGMRPTTKPKPAGRKIEKPTRQEKIISKCEKPVDDSNQEKTEDTVSDDAVCVVEEKEDLITRDDHVGIEKAVEGEKPEAEGETKVSDAKIDEVAEPTEEEVISAAAWEESNEQDQSIPTADCKAEALSETRVRHSLSQMLLEETSEADVTEWGNAENPPTMVYQKDVPKGIKRLLKFARKNKGEQNAALWSSPYGSDGEDDGDEYKSLGKRNSDNLLKVALHSKNHGEGFLSDSEPLSARSNVSNSSARSSRGSRSFFSLSAFRGNKS